MYAFRQAELVGKRFLCVREKNTLRPNSRSRRVANPLDYQWKVGVIRVCSEKDFNHPELKVREFFFSVFTVDVDNVVAGWHCLRLFIEHTKHLFENESRSPRTNRFILS